MKIKVGFFAVCLLLAWIISERIYGLSGLLAAAVHEFGHICVAKILQIPFRSLTLSPYGALLKPCASMGSYSDELLIAAAGPFFNLLSALAIWPWAKGTNSFVFSFFVSSLFLGFLNLLPVSEFDGGRILTCLFCRRLNPLVVSRILEITSFVIVFILWTLSVYLLLRVSSSLSLFVFSCSLFMKLFGDSEFCK